MARTMNSREIIAVVWLPVGLVVMPNCPASLKKVPATTFTKDAITSRSTSRAKMMNSLWALLPMESLITSARERPSWRTEANMAP